MRSTFRCLIVDDETPAHKALISHIAQFEELEYSGSAYSGKEALKMLNENHYDIIFLDINMPVLSGVEVMEMQPIRPLTIVTTAYSDFALSAYQNDVVDYLLKPISLQKFAKAIEKVKAFDAGMNLHKDSENTVKTIVLKVNGEAFPVEISSIIYIESTGNYLKIFCNKIKAPLIIYGTLLSITDLLGSNLFIQVHRSFIVNSLYIADIGQSQLTLLDGNLIPLGRKYKILLSQR